MNREEMDRPVLTRLLYLRIWRRGGSGEDARHFFELRTGKRHTREMTTRQILTLHEELDLIPTVPMEDRPNREDETAWKKRRRKEGLPYETQIKATPD